MHEELWDFHVHVGRSLAGKAVKITASRGLTLPALLEWALGTKGLDGVGIVDAGSPAVLDDLRWLLADGQLTALSGGGFCFRERLGLILGAEMESAESAHFLAYFPTLEEMAGFSRWLSRHVKNPNLSTQRVGKPAAVILEEVGAMGGFLMPAHAFTPHKGLIGTTRKTLDQLFPDSLRQQIWAVELGLSCDTAMADRLAAMEEVTFLSNSDAHSLDKLAREHNALLLKEGSFADVVLALRRRDGRRVTANYGLPPRLGKYYRSFCPACGVKVGGLLCPEDGSHGLVTGVGDLLDSLAVHPMPQSPSHRPPYVHQVPLEFIPGLGPKGRQALLRRFGTELAILHRVSFEDLVQVVGEATARLIMASRQGKLAFSEGYGGIYGRVERGGVLSQE